MPTPEEMAHFQKLSEEYEPDLLGPLVGPKQSTDALVSEYAQGHPVYVAKTSALAATHEFYRIMKGDGNCGWRANIFGYFENLFLLRDLEKIEQEKARLKNFNVMLDAVGHQEELYDMFVQATMELLHKVYQEIESGSYDDTFLVDAFNDEYNATAIIQHFRLMTSAFMRLNRDNYQAFLGHPLDEYCQVTIETVKTEIDEIGLQGLVDGVIAASGFAVQIAYLDRSRGSEVNFHLLTPSRPSLGTIRLLYRPGHYDLLYQVRRQEEPEVPVHFQIGVAYSYSPWYSTGTQFEMNSALMSVPTLTLHDLNTASQLPAFQYPQYGFLPRIYPYFHPPMSLNPPGSFDEMNPQCLPVTSLPPIIDRSDDELQIRMNPLVREPMNTIPLTSIPFRNSQHNQAHFQNPDFQPSQWDYAKEYK